MQPVLLFAYAKSANCYRCTLGSILLRNFFVFAGWLKCSIAEYGGEFLSWVQNVDFSGTKRGWGFSSGPLCGMLCPARSYLWKGDGNVYLAVCEDQKKDLDAVCSLLDTWEAEHDNAMRHKTFQSAAELLESARRERFTHYLLDVMMPGMDGIEAAREIRLFDDAAEIVFLSSSPGFAYESYGVRALDYLLKPVEREKLFALLDRLRLQEQKNAEALTLKTSASFVRVPFTQISYVEVIRKSVYFHLVDGTVREVTGTLKDFESVLLQRPEFMRVHRSYIANMLQVERLSYAGLRTFRGEILPVSRTAYPQLQRDYMALLFDRGGTARE